MIATWWVHDQSRDQCIISHVKTAFSVTWSGPTELRDSFLLIFLTTASWVVWLSAQLFDYCHLSSMIHHSWGPWLFPEDCVICACSALWLLPPEAHRQWIIATWSAHDQSHDQHHSDTWTLHAQSRDLYMISHVISAWSVTWWVHVAMRSVHDETRDQCMGSHVISAW